MGWQAILGALGSNSGNNGGGESMLNTMIGNLFNQRAARAAAESGDDEDAAKVVWANMFYDPGGTFTSLSDIGTGGNMFTGWGGNDEGGDQVSADQLIPTFQRETGEKLAAWIKQYMDNFVPGAAYSGKLSAGMTPQETQGMDILSKYLGGANTGNLFSASKKQIEDTLAGKFADPNASPFIKAMKEVSNQDLQDAINTSRRGAGARGKFFSTASLGEEKDLTNRNLQNINSVIGNFIQNERQNMLNAVPTANAMDQYELATAPLTKVQASQTLGSLSRTLEQADLERQYNDFLRQRTEQAMPISAAQGLYGVSQPYGFKDWTMPGVQNNTASQIAGLLSNVNWQGLMGGNKAKANTNYQGLADYYNNQNNFNYWGQNYGQAADTSYATGGNLTDYFNSNYEGYMY